MCVAVDVRACCLKWGCHAQADHFERCALKRQRTSVIRNRSAQAHGPREPPSGFGSAEPCAALPSRGTARSHGTAVPCLGHRPSRQLRRHVGGPGRGGRLGVIALGKLVSGGGSALDCRHCYDQERCSPHRSGGQFGARHWTEPVGFGSAPVVTAGDSRGGSARQSILSAERRGYAVQSGWTTARVGYKACLHVDSDEPNTDHEHGDCHQLRRRDEFHLHHEPL